MLKRNYLVTGKYLQIIQYLTVDLWFNLYIIYKININNLFEIFSLLNHIKILLPKLACPKANRQPSTPDTTPWIDSINALLATSLWTSSSVKRPSKANIFGAAGKLSWKIENKYSKHKLKYLIESLVYWTKI